MLRGDSLLRSALRHCTDPVWDTKSDKGIRGTFYASGQHAERVRMPLSVRCVIAPPWTRTPRDAALPA